MGTGGVQQSLGEEAAAACSAPPASGPNPTRSSATRSSTASAWRSTAQQRLESAYGGLSQRVAVKVELEQLVISILDDPSVDRVMRDVGFSSSQVRANVKNGAVSSDRARLPYSVYKNIPRAGQPWQENVHQVFVDGDVLHGSHLCISDGTEVVTTLTNPLLSRCQDPNLAGSALPQVGASMSNPNLHTQGGTLGRRKFTELAAENLKIMCVALETRLPRRRDIVPGVSTTLLRCRAVMSTKRSSLSEMATWLLFRGSDEAGKLEMAKELARLVFGSYFEFTIVSSEYSGTSSDQLTRKRRHRSWGDDNGLVGARFLDAILDHESEIRVRNAVADGTMRGYNGDVVSLEDAIVVLSSQLFTSSPPVKRGCSKIRKSSGHAMVESRCHFSLDLNAHAEECEEEKDDSASGDDDMGIQDAMDGVFLFD